MCTVIVIVSQALRFLIKLIFTHLFNDSIKWLSTTRYDQELAREVAKIKERWVLKNNFTSQDFALKENYFSADTPNCDVVLSVAWNL